MKTAHVATTYDWHRAVVGNVSTHALALVLVLTHHMNTDGTLPHRFTPSLETLSKEMGYAPNSRRGCVRWMKELEDKGFLQVTRGPRRSRNHYRATVPVEATAPVEAGALVAPTPPPLPTTVAAGDPDSGSAATLPNPSYSKDPTRPNGRTVARLLTKDEEAERRQANEVLRRVCAKLPDHEAQAIGNGVARLDGADHLRRLLARVQRSRRTDELVNVTTSARVGLPSPYFGAADPAAVFFARVQAYLTSTPTPSAPSSGPPRKSMAPSRASGASG